MRLNTLLVSVGVASILGAAQAYALLLGWSYVAAYSPLPRYLLDIGLEGATYRAVLFPIDFLTSVILSLPAAALLLKLRPRRLWLYLLLAVIPGFIWLNLGLVGNPVFSQFAGSFVLGWIPQVFALPVAAWLLRFLLERGAPSTSFGPNPLRESA